MPSMQRSPETRRWAPAPPPEPDKPTVNPWLARLLVVGGGVGLIAAVILTVERIRLITDPEYVPSCDLNPILSCGTVMGTPQASVFGFPNSIIGVAGFAMVTAIGAALLAGAVFAEWFWVGLQIGVTAGVVFVHWLIAQSLWQIEALCPYCMVVWIVTVPMFWYVTLRNVKTWADPSSRWARAITAFHAVPLTAWYGILVATIAIRFWDFWVTQI